MCICAFYASELKVAILASVARPLAVFALEESWSAEVLPSKPLISKRFYFEKFTEFAIVADLYKMVVFVRGFIFFRIEILRRS